MGREIQGRKKGRKKERKTEREKEREREREQGRKEGIERDSFLLIISINFFFLHLIVYMREEFSL